MKVERNIKDLLILVRNSLKEVFKSKDGIFPPAGICSVIHKLQTLDIITLNEYSILMDYLDGHIPKNAKIRYKRYHNTYYASEYALEFFWWKPGVINSRIKWLNEQINKL